MINLTIKNANVLNDLNFLIEKASFKITEREIQVLNSRFVAMITMCILSGDSKNTHCKYKCKHMHS